LILELIAQVKDAKIFSKFDVRQGYNNVRIKEGDEHKAAFKTKYGLFEPLVMFFGLRNSPSTFQAMMDQEFRDIIEEQRLLGTEVIIYMDDILIASTSLTGHRNAVHAVTFFLSYHCAHNGLSLGPSSLLRHTSPSRTDYDSYTSF
jgi:hypothetical protein